MYSQEFILLFQQKYYLTINTILELKKKYILNRYADKLYFATYLYPIIK